MKKRKISFVILLLQVCSLEHVSSKQHRGSGDKNRKPLGLYSDKMETSRYIGKNNVFKMEQHLSNPLDKSSHSAGCSHCNRTSHNGASGTDTYNLYHKHDSKGSKRQSEELQKKVKRMKVDDVKSTHRAMVQKRNVLTKMKLKLGDYNYTDANPYGAPNQGGYPPQGQVPNQGVAAGPYGAAPGPAPGADQAAYGAQNPGVYPQPGANPSVGAAPAPAQSYTPEQYPQPGSVPTPDGSYGNPYAAKTPDMMQPNPYQASVPGQYPSPQQPGQQPYYGTPNHVVSSQLDDDDDVHNSWKCRFLPFFFEECNRVDVKPNQMAGMMPPPSSPISQQYCNMYGTSDLNLSDFNSNSDQWLLVNQNNSLKLTSSRPVQYNIQTLELKGNLCNKENLSCTLQLGENSTAGLSIRGSDNQKTLVELNSLTKAISLKQVNGGTTQVLLEQPFPKLNPNFLHLVQVNDGGFQGTLSVFVDGELVFTKTDVPTQSTGSMGLYISSGNATFGNFSVTPVS